MKLLCPICRGDVDISELTCVSNHEVKKTNGVITIVNERFESHLNNVLPNILEFQSKNDVQIPIGAIPELPYSLKTTSKTWKVRCHDLKRINNLISGNELKVLEIGSQNGWLGYQLTKNSHNVTSISYFNDSVFGLGVAKHFPLDWIKIQMDESDLSIFNSKFDLIVFNRCISYFDINSIIAQAKELLDGNGEIIITGLNVYSKIEAIHQKNLKLDNEFKEQYGHSVFINPTKGYVDEVDKSLLIKAGFKILETESFFKRTIKKLLGRKHFSNNIAYYKGS